MNATRPAVWISSISQPRPAPIDRVSAAAIIRSAIRRRRMVRADRVSIRLEGFGVTPRTLHYAH